MSLEQAITDHASALRELAAAIRATVGAGVADVATAAAAHQVINEAKKPTKTETPVAKDTADVKKPDAGSPAATGSKPEAGRASSDEPAPPTYDDVKAKVLALSKEKGRDPTVQVLRRHGVEKAPDLKPAQYADFIKDVDAIMAGTYNPEAAETV